MRYTSSYCDSDNVIVIVTAVRSVITNARRCTDQSYGTVYDGFRQDVGVVSSLKITINTFRKLNFFFNRSTFIHSKCMKKTLAE